MSGTPKKARVLNAFESFQAGAPLSEGMSKTVKHIESRRSKVDLKPREFAVYSRAVAASGVAKEADAPAPSP